MISTDDLPPGVEEQYLSATHSSNLRVEADRRSDADILIAMGWSAKNLGGALMRLHSEWDGASKRAGMSETDLLLLRAQLKSLPRAIEDLAAAMALMGVAAPNSRVGPILGYWLYQTCHICEGRKFEKVRNTPALSALRCKACHGVGTASPPRFPETRRVLNLMDDCVSRARDGIKRRLHSPYCVNRHI